MSGQATMFAICTKKDEPPCGRWRNPPAALLYCDHGCCFISYRTYREAQRALSQGHITKRG